MEFGMLTAPYGLGLDPVYREMYAGVAVAVGDIVMVDLNAVYPPEMAEVSRFSVIKTPATLGGINGALLWPAMVVTRAGGVTDQVTVQCSGVATAKVNAGGAIVAGAPLYTKTDSEELTTSSATGRIVAFLLDPIAGAGNVTARVLWFGCDLK